MEKIEIDKGLLAYTRYLIGIGTIRKGNSPIKLVKKYMKEKDSIQKKIVYIEEI